MNDRRCGYALTDDDGVQFPCDRPATGFRWYQDVEHEDSLDVACDLHANEGGRRMREMQEYADHTSCVESYTALAAERDDLRVELEKARLDLHDQAVEIETRRSVIAQSDISHLRLIETMVDALDIGDGVTEEQAAERLGCDCGGVGGSRHLLWHLIEQRDDLRARLAKVEALTKEMGAAHDFDQWDDLCVQLRAALTPKETP